MASNTIICIDNSEDSVNGDFPPNRLRVQQEAVSEILHLRISPLPPNHEATIALIAMGGRTPTVVCALNRNKVQMGKRLQALQPSGRANPLRALQIARLMCTAKRKKNDQLTASVLLFLGSVPEDLCTETLLSIVPQLTEEKMKLEVVAFGSSEETRELVRLFRPLIDALGPGNSQLVVVPERGDFNRTVFYSLDSLKRGGRVNVPETMPTPMDEADDELMLAIALSIQEEAKRTKGKTTASTTTVPGTALSGKESTTGKESDSKGASSAKNDLTDLGKSHPAVSALKSLILKRKSPSKSSARIIRVPSPYRPGTSSAGEKTNQIKIKIRPKSRLGPSPAEVADRVLSLLVSKGANRPSMTPGASRGTPSSRPNSRSKGEVPGKTGKTFKGALTSVARRTPSPGRRKHFVGKRPPRKDRSPRVSPKRPVNETDDSGKGGKRVVRRTNNRTFASSAKSGKEGKSSEPPESLLAKMMREIPEERPKTQELEGDRPIGDSPRDESRVNQRKMSLLQMMRDIDTLVAKEYDCDPTPNQLKVNSWLYRNPLLFPERLFASPRGNSSIKSSKPRSLHPVFNEKAPKKRAKPLKVDQSKLQEIIDGKLRSINETSASKITFGGRDPDTVVAPSSTFAPPKIGTTLPEAKASKVSPSSRSSNRRPSSRGSSKHNTKTTKKFKSSQRGRKAIPATTMPAMKTQRRSTPATNGKQQMTGDETLSKEFDSLQGKRTKGKKDGTEEDAPSDQKMTKEQPKKDI